MFRFWFALLLVMAPLVSASLVGCSRSSTSDSAASGDRPGVAFVTTGVASFWQIAESGAVAGGEEFDADVTVLMPNGITEQKRVVEDLLTKGIDGIAISPIDPDNQADLINTAAKNARVITADSNAPKSDRECYIGVDNYSAGRMCGDLVVEALPEGGKVAIFIGRLEQDNARRRRQGVIDAILDRSVDATRFDAPDAEIKEGKWHIVGTYTDQFDRTRKSERRRRDVAAQRFGRHGRPVRVQPAADFGSDRASREARRDQGHRI